MKIVAERIKGLRMERGIGQNLMAKELGVSNASISYWENAKQEPSAQAIYKMARYFGVTTDYLLGIEND